jgi:hypothetical protein
MEEVKLLGPPGKYGVVRLQQRKFPGLVIQGDALHEMIKSLASIKKMYDEGHLEAAGEEFDYLIGEMSAMESYYVAVCQKNEISLPFPTSKQDKRPSL